MFSKLRKNRRRLLAFLLTVAMTFTNVGMNLNVTFAAGEEEEALFLIKGTDLQAAVQEAAENGEPFDFSTLNLKTDRSSVQKKYKELLDANGMVYELDVEVDDSYAPDAAGIKVFYNAKTDEVVFLFLNESDMLVRFRVNLDGYETPGVLINPNPANVGDETLSNAVNYSDTTMIRDEKETLGAVVLNPTQSDEETETGEAETEEAEVEEPETGEAETEEAAEPETETEAAESSPETDSEEAETEDSALEEVFEQEPSEQEEPELIVVEPETVGEEEPEPETEVKVDLDFHAASISLHRVPRVATSVTVLDEELGGHLRKKKPKKQKKPKR